MLSAPSPSAKLEQPHKEGLSYEHIVPRSYFAKMLLSLKKAQISKRKVDASFQEFCVACVLTEKEDMSVKPNATMPKKWDGKDAWARYRSVSRIKIGQLDKHSKWKPYSIPSVE